jgi:regulatory protein
VKQWGKIRIELALKEKKVSSVCIRNALADIDEGTYRKTLEKILKNRLRQVHEPDERKKKYQAARYAISRGFEPGLVWQLLGGDE